MKSGSGSIRRGIGGKVILTGQIGTISNGRNRSRGRRSGAHIAVGAATVPCCHGAMTPAQALNVFENALAASLGKASSKEEQDVAPVTVEALEGVREGLADMVN